MDVPTADNLLGQSGRCMMWLYLLIAAVTLLLCLIVIDAEEVDDE